MPLSYLELDEGALVSNARSLRPKMPAAAEMVAVVKGNAYGHGQSEVVQILENEVDAFQVDDIEELRVLRRVSSKPALVYGYVARADFEEAVRLDSEIVLYDTERLEELGRLARRHSVRPRVSIKIDALLGRQGLQLGDIPGFIDAARQVELQVVSAYAHFANIEDTTELTHAGKQIRCFEQGFELLKAEWPHLKRHYSATSGLLAFGPATHLGDRYRLGVGLYGLYPSPELEQSNQDVVLTPIARWVSHLAQVKTLPAGHPVGYGLTYVTSKKTKLGIVPQGYADGYDRGLSNAGEVLVSGIRCPVLGRIAMNMFAVDLSAIPDVAPEEEVVLLGRQGSESITSEEIANRIGTINYEVTTRISALLPRVVAK